MAGLAFFALLACGYAWIAWVGDTWWALLPPAVATLALGLWAVERGPLTGPGGGDVDPLSSMSGSRRSSASWF